MTKFVENMVKVIEGNGMNKEERKEYIERKTKEVQEQLDIVKDDKNFVAALENVLNDIDKTFNKDVAAKIWEEAPYNERRKKVGPLAYTYIKTKFKEITFLTNYSETAITVVIDKDMNIKKISTSGKGSRSNTDRLKMMGEEEFTAILDGTSNARKDETLKATYYIR